MLGRQYQVSWAVLDYRPGSDYYCPERTTLAGKVAHEVNCIAVDNEESRYLLEMRTLEAMKPKLGTKFLNEDTSGVGTGFIQPGTVSAMNSMRGFIVSTFPTLFPLARCANTPVENQGNNSR